MTQTSTQAHMHKHENKDEKMQTKARKPIRGVTKQA